MPAFVQIAGLELHIARRNMWVTIAVVLTVLFSTVLAAAGNMPAAGLKVDALAVTVASLTTLSVYLVPLIALLLGFDAIAGERERGTLALLYCYPVDRGSILLGKMSAHMSILALALAFGFGAAGALSAIAGDWSTPSVLALIRLYASAVLLGASFLSAAYLVSSMVRQSSAAAGMAFGLWIVMVVLYDLGLLGALIFDGGGSFTATVFPWLLVLNPADAFRTFNFLSSDLMATASGLIGSPEGLPLWTNVLSLILWPIALLSLAWTSVNRRTQ